VTAALLLALLAAGSTPGTLVDRVVAVVDKQVVTQSELLLEARVALLLREGEVAATAELDDQALKAFLDYLVNQLLIAGQARRLGGVEVTAAEVEHDLRELARRFRSPDAYRAFLRRFDATEDQLRNILARTRRNERFIGDRMRLIGAADRAADPGSPQYQQALRRWLDELRDAVDVRLLGPTNELELQPRRTPPPAAEEPAS
jgi:hypothetical protein